VCQPQPQNARIEICGTLDARVTAAAAACRLFLFFGILRAGGRVVHFPIFLNNSNILPLRCLWLYQYSIKIHVIGV